MSELITDEMVEAAAAAIADAYDDMTQDDIRSMAQIEARAALEATAALIAGRALGLAADAWQQGEWADAPRRADPAHERLANAQHVTNWLRARSEKEADRG